MKLAHPNSHFKSTIKKLLENNAPNSCMQNENKSSVLFHHKLINRAINNGPLNAKHSRLREWTLLGSHLINQPTAIKPLTSASALTCFSTKIRKQQLLLLLIASLATIALRSRRQVSLSLSLSRGRRAREISLWYGATRRGSVLFFLTPQFAELYMASGRTRRKKKKMRRHARAWTENNRMRYLFFVLNCVKRLFRVILRINTVVDPLFK